MNYGPKYTAWEWDVFGDNEIVIIKNKKPSLYKMIMTVLIIGSKWTEKHTDRFGVIVELDKDD